MALADQIRVMKEADLLDEAALDYWITSTRFPERLEPCCLAAEVDFPDNRVCPWWFEQLKKQKRKPSRGVPAPSDQDGPDLNRRPYFFVDGKRPTEEEKNAFNTAVTRKRDMPNRVKRKTSNKPPTMLSAWSNDNDVQFNENKSKSIKELVMTVLGMWPQKNAISMFSCKILVE